MMPGRARKLPPFGWESNWCHACSGLRGTRAYCWPQEHGWFCCRYVGESSKLNPYEQSAAAFLFFTFVLSVAATYFAIRAVQEIRQKQVCLVLVESKLVGCCCQ